MMEGKSLLQEGQRKGPYKISSKKLHQELLLTFGVPHWSHQFVARTGVCCLLNNVSSIFAIVRSS